MRTRVMQTQQQQVRQQLPRFRFGRKEEGIPAVFRMGGGCCCGLRGGGGEGVAMFESL